MGKHGKKQSHQHQQRRGRRAFSYNQEEEEPDCAEEQRDVEESENGHASQEEEEEEGGGGRDNEFNQSASNEEAPSKFLLYQQSVQSPKGDISYLQKFFLMYVGGRVPLHLQEDFCGTALLSTEWLRTDARRTAVGLDLDIEALDWCMNSNINKIGADVYSRMFLFHGNVLKPLQASLVTFDPQDLGQSIRLEDHMDGTNVTAVSNKKTHGMHTL